MFQFFTLFYIFKKKDFRHLFIYNLATSEVIPKILFLYTKGVLFVIQCEYLHDLKTGAEVINEISA